MWIFVARRIFSAALTMLALVAITFAVMKAVPGGPFDTEKALPTEVKANLEAKFLLDRPVYEQFTHYLSNLAHGDFGLSYRYMGSRSVNEIIAETLPVSMILGAAAVVLSTLAGIFLGVVSAWKRGGVFDLSAMFLAVAGVSLPNYLLASLLILVFSLKLGWFPPALWEGPSSAVLPVVTLAMRPLALVARLTRASMLEVLDSDYVRTAKGKGLSTNTVLFKHALKNALLPVVTMLGPITASLITGSFVVEVMFAVPGMGKHFVSAVTDRDYTLILGITIVYGVIVIAANLLVDLFYAWLDPRIRVEY